MLNDNTLTGRAEAKSVESRIPFAEPFSFGRSFPAAS